MKDYSIDYLEKKRGYWFTERNQIFLYSYDNNNKSFYLLDEQEQFIMKTDNKEHIRLLKQTYALQIEQELIDWLTDESKSGLKYFDNIDELEKYWDEM